MQKLATPNSLPFLLLRQIRLHIAGYIAIHLALLCLPRVAAGQPAPACDVLGPPTPLGLVSFEADHGYDLRVEKQDDGLHVRVIADSLTVNATDTQSLVRSPADAATGIAELILDARRISIAAPISLTTGKVLILGEEVEFARAGRLSMTHRATNADGLSIVARRLRFQPGIARPIDVPVHGDASRSIRIAAVDVYQGDQLLSSEQAQIFLWERTIDSAFVNMPPANWAVQQGNSATSVYQAAVKDTALWPIRFAGKVASHLARDPYGTETRRQLEEAISDALPALSGYRDSKPLLDVLRFRSLLRNKLDLGGYSASFAPRQSLNHQLKVLESAVDSLRNNTSYLSGLRELYLAPLDQAPIRKSVVDSLDLRIAERQRDVMAIRSGLDAKITELATLGQQAEAVRPLLAQRRDIVRVLTEREIRRQRDASSIKQWSTVAATAVALGATLVGAAPVGAAIAAGIASSGEVAYQHNTDGLGWEDVGTISQKGTSVYQNSMALADKWKEYKQRERDLEQVLAGREVRVGPPPPAGQSDNREVLTKGRAAVRAAEALGTFGSEVSKLTGGLNPTGGPTPVSLSSKESEDAEIIGYIDRMARLAKRQSDVSAEIEAANLQLANLATAIESERLARDQLLASNPANDRELYRWQSNARLLWHLEVARLAEASSLLRRSLYFETGRLPAGPADALYYPTEFAALAQFGGADPFSAYVGEGMENALRKHLAEEERRFLVSLDALVRGVAAARTSYLAARTDATVYRFSHQFRRTSARPKEAAFIAALNGQLAQQLALRTPINDVLPAPVPLSFAVPPLDLPERVLSVRVTKVEFARPVNLLGSGLRFQIIHPGVGQLRLGGKCVIADLRTSDAAENRRVFVTDVNAIDGEWPQREPTTVSLTEDNRFYVYYPLRTAFEVLAQVTTDPDGWSALPEIANLEISWEVMQ